MRIFVTGGSGWIGSAVIPELLRGNHEVLALARSDTSAAALAQAGAEVIRGDLDDVALLQRAADRSDGVIHLAFRHDVAPSADGMASAAATDRQVIEAIGEALAGSDRPLAIASGTPNLLGRVASERDSSMTTGPMAARGANAQAVVELAQRGVRSSVVRLPRSVHGAGDAHGFIARLVAIAQTAGVSGYVGDGSSRWPAVHALDAARLFTLAVTEAPAGAVLHAVGDQGVPTRQIAETIGRGLGLPTASMPSEHFGFLGMVLAGDQPASCTLTRELLGWQPVEPGLLADIEMGHYFALAHADSF